MDSDKSIKYDNTMLFKAFIQLMPVAILGMVIPSLNSVIDTIVASRFIGVHAVTALGFYNPLMYIFLGVNAMLLGGSTIIMGKLLGSGKSKEANDLFSTDMITIVVSVFVVGIITLFFSTQISRFLGAQNQALALTISYINGMALSYPATYGITHLSSFLELEQRHIRNYIGVGAMLILNLIMDIIFVVVLDMGTLGLGIATSIASWLDFLFLAQYYFTQKALLKFSTNNFKAALIPQILTVGFPGAVTQIYLAARGYMCNSMLLQYSGAMGIAALAAQSTFGSLEYGVSYGIAVACRTLFSIFVGSNDSDSIKHVFEIAFKKILPLSLLYSCVMAALSVPLTRIFYIPEAWEVYKLTVGIFVCFPLAMFLSGIGQIFSNYYQCHMWMKITNVISFVDGFAGMAICMLILAPVFGAYGVWLSFIGNGLVVIIVIIAYTIIKNKRLPVCLDDYLMLPADFDIPSEHRLSFSVHNKEEVVQCSEKIEAFCQKENVAHKKSYYSALAMEEMADNVVEKGFAGKPGHTCVIEVANSSEEIILRIMDDGIDFNPLQRLEVIDQKDVTKNIGIRLVRKLADDMEYTRVIGLNILTIHIQHN